MRNVVNQVRSIKGEVLIKGNNRIAEAFSGPKQCCVSECIARLCRKPTTARDDDGHTTIKTRKTYDPDEHSHDEQYDRSIDPADRFPGCGKPWKTHCVQVSQGSRVAVAHVPGDRLGPCRFDRAAASC